MVEMRDLVPALLDFSLSWVLSLLTVLLLLHLKVGVFTPRCCALEVYTFLFDFLWRLQVAFQKRLHFRIGLKRRHL